MSSLAEYTRRVQATVESSKQFTLKTTPEAKLALKQIVQTQRELRQIKKEIGLDAKSLRAQYADQKEKVSHDGVGKGIMQGIFGKKSVGRMDAAQKDQIRKNQVKQIAPFEELQRRIDTILIAYDKQKLQIEAWITEQSNA